MTRIDTPRTGTHLQAADGRRDRGETQRDPFRDPRRDPSRDGGQDAFGARRDLPGRRESGADGAPGQAKGRGAAKDGSRDAPFGFDGSGSTFQRMVEDRTREDERSDRHGSGAHEDSEDGRLVLAVVEPAAASVAPVAAAEPPVAPSPAPPGDAPPLAGEASRMVALAERVDTALRLDRLAQTRGEGTFRLVGEAAGGLESVGIALTPHGLDVTLVHAFAAGRDDLCRAAAILAQQLQDRFPTRRVRILQGDPAVTAAASGLDGLTAIGRLFARPPVS